MAKVGFYNFLGTYNKAYKSKKVDKTDFNIFIKNLYGFYKKLENIDTTNEDLLKGVFNECWR